MEKTKYNHKTPWKNISQQQSRYTNEKWERIRQWNTVSSQISNMNNQEKLVKYLIQAQVKQKRQEQAQTCNNSDINFLM